MATTRVRIEGPLFDGSAAAAAEEFCTDLTQELAEIGRDWIQIEAHGMDKSGRNTGAAAEGVEVTGRGRDRVIRGGIEAGRFSWPWLEGVSERNTTTPFKGYHTFRRTRLRMRRQATPYAQERMREFIARMGGTAF